MPRLFRLALLVALVPVASAQTGSQNLTLIGQLNPRAADGYADIWGYVAPNGREYALLNTRGGGMTVIDVTVMPPVEVAYIPGSGIGSDIEVYQHYVYVSNDLANTRIFSLADPTNPVHVGTVPTDAHTITIAGDYLYTQGGPSTGGVLIYSLADPANPAYLGEYQVESSYVHDIHVRGDTMYAALINGVGVDIVDLSDRANPTLINRFNYPASGAHNVCTTEDGSFAFVGDEVGAGRWTRIFDVRDPMNVELVGEIIVDPSTTVHNCHVLGDLLYIGYYDGYGARVYDISDPVAPVEVAYYETGSGMTWSVYPHLPSGKIIASLYLSGGLRVFHLDDAVAHEPGTDEAGALALTAAPNPVRGTGTLRFALPQSAEVRLAIHDVLGREVAVLAGGLRQAGAHEAALDASSLPPGVYVARLTAGDRIVSARLTVAR